MTAAESLAGLRRRYRSFGDQHLSLDMTRGKPCPQQLDLSRDMLSLDYRALLQTPSKIDCRNYGVLEGLPEARELFAEYMGVEPEQILIGSNSSLSLMHDTIVRALYFGVPGRNTPWKDLSNIKFLCPVPGYDRHFAICERFGIQMIPVAMLDDGPNMEEVESMVSADPYIKGIWCVPQYSNPTGVTFSDNVVKRLACMTTAADDFRIFWDNAYAVHHLTDNPTPLLNILNACTSVDNSNRVFLFGSTSKITCAGSGISMFAGSAENIAWFRTHMAIQTIGHDKVNQRRHVLFLRSMDGIRAHMLKHAEILRPKFEAVQRILTQEFSTDGITEWSNPKGGYFVSLNTPSQCASKTVSLAAEIGVKLTPAGAAFPYHDDPMNRQIRIAPSFPSCEEVEKAIEVVAVCSKIAAINR